MQIPSLGFNVIAKIIATKICSIKYTNNTCKFSLKANRLDPYYKIIFLMFQLFTMTTRLNFDQDLKTLQMKIDSHKIVPFGLPQRQRD